MEFYFRKDGQMLGPLMIFKVRSLAEEKKLAAEDLAWHEGMEEWVAAKDVPALEMIFGQKPSDQTSEVEFLETESSDNVFLRRQKAEGVPPLLPSPVMPSPAVSKALYEAGLLMRQRTARAWQRLLARFIDLLLFTLLFLAVGVQFGLLEPGELVLPRTLIPLEAALAWIFCEVICVKFWGATPGKMMLGLQVVTADDQSLTWRQAFSRAFDVWFVGCGMELPILSSLLKLVSFFRYRQTGTTSWDAQLELKVVHRPVTSLGIILATLLVVGVMVVKTHALFHYPLPSHLDPEFRNYYEKMLVPPEEVPVKPPETMLKNKIV